ncbi:MAG: saccharopine dehydrogenase NADP-binding domain-containing protein [Phycisphaerales bacterium]|nr:saccharopine dehydrogenase NADP-binding domain-containing protein [Phycisphaerales bacterium]
MKKKVLVLGCGLVGATMARDLAEDRGFDVAVADLNPTNLDKLSGEKNIRTIQADLGEAEAVKEIAGDFDFAVGAMPSRLGLQTLKAVIESGKSFCDISFMVEDPTALDNLAKDYGVTVVYDCGVAPGLANMIIGHCHAQLEKTDSVVYYVGGLPKQRAWPYEYKAPFAPSDVIEEYTRPARLIEDGHEVVKPALSEPEAIEFRQVGILEAFNTDGLRSLLRTISAPNMKEKTLRYPGHCELMRVLRETGFFSKEQIEIGDRMVRPLEVTSKLLFDRWRLEPHEEEFTILRVIVEGTKANKTMRYTYDLYDEYHAATGQHSMARTTGFPCVITARMIVEGAFTKPGVFPPECIGAEPGLFDRMTEALAARGVTMTNEATEMD